MFIGMVEAMPNAPLNQVVKFAAKKFPDRFGKLQHSTAKPFPEKTEKKKIRAEDDLAAEKARKQRQFRVERNKSCGKHKEQTPLTEREAMVPDDLSTHRSQGGGPQRILPITLLVQMGMLLFTQSQAGVPMHCAVIDPPAPDCCGPCLRPLRQTAFTAVTCAC